MKFYKETNFQKTPLGRLPVGWSVVRFGSIILGRDGIVKGKKPELEGSGSVYPYLNLDYLRYGKVTAYSYLVDPKLLVRDGDLILLWDGSNAGEFFRGRFGVLGSTMVKFNFVSGVVDSDFVYYLAKKFLEPSLRGTTKGTGIPHVDRRMLLNSLIPLPPLSEQKKIAKVLMDFDEFIELIDRKTGLLKKIKEKLMDVYFTRGVFNHKSFQKTPLGMLPVGWKVVRLGNVADVVMGQSPPSDTYNTEGIGLPFLQGSKEFGDVYPRPERYCSKPLKVARRGDILISVRAPVGDVNIAPFDCAIGRGLAAIRPKSIDMWFLFYLLIFSKDRLNSGGGGSIFNAIGKDTLTSFQIPLPPLSEQMEIARRLRAFDEEIRRLKEVKEVVEKMKEKLMDLLLTSKIRIK